MPGWDRCAATPAESRLTLAMDADAPAATTAPSADTADLHVEHAALHDHGAWLCCVPCHWLRTNNSVHKASLTIATLLVTSLLVASPVLFLISSIPGANQRTKECLKQDDEGCSRDETRVDATCVGDACIRTATRLLSSMSRQTNPCRDFYQFACGGWGKEVDSLSPLPLPSLSFNTLQDYVNQQIQELLAAAFSSKQFQKLGHFYNSCLKTKERRTNIGPIFTLLDELGGYLGPGAPDPPDLSPLLASLLKVNGALLFDVYLDRDLQDPSRLGVFIDLPRRYGHTSRLLQRPQSEVTLDATLRAQYQLSGVQGLRSKRSQNKESRAYSYMKESAEERRLVSLEKLLHEFFPANLTSEERIKEAHSILLFASMLNKLYPREKDIINKVHQKDSYRTYNLTQLQEIYEFVQWQPLMEEVFSSNFSGSDVVYVVAPTYLASLQKTMPHFHNRVAHNALLLIYARDILLELVNATAQPSWPGFCTRVCVNLFPRAVGALYVQQFSPVYLEELRKQVTIMFDRLRGALTTRIKELAWLDDTTRVAALRKLASLKGQFLTWPGIWNSSGMSLGLQEANIDSEDFFGNVIRRYRQLRTMPHDFRNQTTSVDKKWAYPFVVNAFYELTSNSIVIPLALLTQPYFRGDVPRYVRYATIGVVLAHEIMHAFDLTGIGYGPDGSSHDWFTPDARLRLEARLDCVARQYAGVFTKKVHFLGSSVNIQFDWNLTRNENMADMSGLQVAYDSWHGLDREGVPDPRLPSVNLSPTQLFFLNAAQAYCSNLSPEDYILLVEMDFHTPFPERINGIMMNSPAFAEAFNCPTSSPMNPSKKCSTW